MNPKPIPPGPGQESVWDYPRPPRLEPTSKRIEVIHAGQTIADTREAYRVLETSHPPVYYLPPESIRPGVLQQTWHESWCEWKGRARYFNLVLDQLVVPRAAWSYTDPTPGFQAIQFYLAFYAGLLDECRVNGEKVAPQPGGFYGGWITRDVVGPFKGDVGTLHW